VQLPGAAGADSPLGRALHLVLGPPGTGKTTRLLDLLHAELERGTPADRIAFVSFTRAAREEACSRVRRDLRLGDDELPWFRTIHSAAYRLRGLTKAKVMGPAAWFTFALKHGYDLSSPTADSDDDPLAPPARTSDDLLRWVLDWSRNRRLTLDQGLGCSRVNVPAVHARRFAERLEAFKAERGLVDFAGMLERVLIEGQRPDVEVAFIDEAQDLSPLQIAVVEQWFAGCERVYVGGDDDQCIYSFQGAEPSWLVGLCRRASCVEILRESHRVPATVHDLAGRIIRQNRQRIDKPYEPRAEPGAIFVLPPDRVLPAVAGTSSVFVLARNRVFLEPWAERLLAAGEAFVYEGRGARSPLDDPRVTKAVGAGFRLRDGKAIDAEGLRALLHFVPSRGSDLVPHGVKSRAEQNDMPVTPAELVTDWQLGRLFEALDREGPVQLLLTLSTKQRSYLERLLARHDHHLPEPRFRLSTIHGAKGREADVVVLIPDMTRATQTEYLCGGPEGEEAENRVAYVAVTRARKGLVIVEPQTRRSYPYWRLLPRRETRPAVSPNGGTQALPT
jgi:DNA helicase-2/ATP-dependent DNA helicase PcrA